MTQGIVVSVDGTEQAHAAAGVGRGRGRCCAAPASSWSTLRNRGPVRGPVRDGQDGESWARICSHGPPSGCTDQSTAVCQCPQVLASGPAPISPPRPSQ